LYSNSAEIPSTIGNLTKLTYFLIDYSLKLGGSLPSSFGNLTLLEYFKISRTGIAGVIPEGMSNLSVLNEFLVDDNYLTGKIPVLSSTLTNCNLAPNNFTCYHATNTVCQGSGVIGTTFFT
jgi:Leucine-rich repeat (LRR) protein